MLVSKAQFIYYVNKYKEAWEEQHRFHDALRPFFDFPVCTYRDDLLSAYESLLTTVSECQDEDGIFAWWATELDRVDSVINVKHTDTGDEEAFDVKTAEGLYEYLYYMYHHED